MPLSIDQHTFNETLKLAIREFQRVASVPSSGQFDNQTLQLFGRQRCALSDTEIVRLNRRQAFFALNFSLKTTLHYI